MSHASLVAKIDPHARIGRPVFAQHGHDRIVGSYHMRGPHLVGH
jgi:serine acetyltransferase